MMAKVTFWDQLRQTESFTDAIAVVKASICQANKECVLNAIVQYLQTCVEHEKIPHVDKNDTNELTKILLALVNNEKIMQEDVAKPAESDDDILTRLLADQIGYEFILDFDGHLSAVYPRKGLQFTLERQNWHVRDASIIFDDPSHTYFQLEENQEPKRFSGSVSSAYSRFFSHFDPVDIVHKNFARWFNDKRKPYHEITRLICAATTAIKKSNSNDVDDTFAKETLVRVLRRIWDLKNRRVEASTKGTLMHLAIEQRLNGVHEIDVQPNLTYNGEITLPESQYTFFCALMKKEGLRPFRSEWSVYSSWPAAESLQPPVRLCGQIDSLWIDEQGLFHMIDWKRCKIADLGPQQNSYGRYGFGPCINVPDTDFGHYACQQACYALILKTSYDISVTSMRLAQFHPEALDEKCRMINIPVNFYIDVAEGIVESLGGVIDKQVSKKPRLDADLSHSCLFLGENITFV